MFCSHISTCLPFFSEFQLARTLADFLGAGSETSTSIIRWAVLYFMHNPEIPENMRREMKEHVGDSVPSLEDRKSLPYCRSVIAEIMRIKPVTPLAAPHSNHVDLHINNTVIPKGSTLIMNVRSIFEDPEIYEEPEVLKPSRFLNKHGDYVPSEHINSLFGAGRYFVSGSPTISNILKKQTSLYLMVSIQAKNVLHLFLFSRFYVHRFSF